MQPKQYLLTNISQYLTRMEKKSLEITNDKITNDEITNDGSAFLLLLPSEILTEIMSFAMASDVPVFFWVFRDLNDTFEDLLKQRGDSKTLPRFYIFPESQHQHLLDWVGVTGTCRRLREYGIPAFFREKSFLVPPRMLRGLLDGGIRSSNFDMAMDCIRKVVVPVDSFINGSDFMMLPKYHRFTRLRTITVRALDSRYEILDDKRREKPWPQETPKELHDLLRQLGLRVDITRLKLVIMASEESVVPSLIESMEQGIYPLLRTLIHRRAKPGVAPP